MDTGNIEERGDVEDRDRRWTQETERRGQRQTVDTRNREERGDVEDRDRRWTQETERRGEM